MEIGFNFNIHARRFQLFKLRFYLATFHVLGLMRLKFEKSKNKVFLTPYSVTVARIVGLFFFYIHCHTIYSQYKKELYILPVVFMLSLLVQPRTVIEKRVRLINQFLEISQYYYYRQKFKIPWTLPIVVFINLKITSKIMSQQSEIKKIQLLLIPISFLSFLIIYMTTDLLSTGISILTNYFEIVNDEMNEITRMLPIAILQKDNKMVKKLHRRTRILKETHDYLTQITRKVFTNLHFHLTFMIILNINFFFSNLFGFSLNQLIVSNSLRYFIYSLDKLLVRSFEWQGIPWTHMAHQYEFENILGHYERLERTPYIRKDLDWANRLSNQSLVHHLIKRKFNILGMFSPTRRFLCKMVFAIISWWYLRKMMGLAA
ncbi:hypothetical protein KR067_002193 [Drosophila pandora]|nr:hypothetical protein KR067_002193 [Drosophila pandora]